MRKWDEKLDSRAAKKGAKKLVSIDHTKKLVIKIQETCKKTMFTPSNPIKATNPSIIA
jgi:hypothetical protein